jgi:hypothetical protein
VAGERGQRWFRRVRRAPPDTTARHPAAATWPPCRSERPCDDACTSLIEISVDGDTRLRLTYLDRATLQREARLYRTRGVDGRLTMIRWCRERALAFLALPMQEYYMKMPDLDPASARADDPACCWPVRTRGFPACGAPACTAWIHP